MLSFRITHEETGGRARVGVLTTARSEVATPAFMPVGSLGNVRSVDGEELLKMGFERPSQFPVPVGLSFE